MGIVHQPNAFKHLIPQEEKKEEKVDMDAIAKTVDYLVKKVKTMEKENKDLKKQVEVLTNKE